jgi:hypothetical protein
MHVRIWMTYSSQALHAWKQASNASWLVAKTRHCQRWWNTRDWFTIRPVPSESDRRVLLYMHVHHVAMHAPVPNRWLSPTQVVQFARVLLHPHESAENCYTESRTDGRRRTCAVQIWSEVVVWHGIDRSILQVHTDVLYKSYFTTCS